MWTASVNNMGYGRLGSGGRGTPVILAHRFAYELLAGSIAEGMELDHLCRNRACVNPAHLEAVTHGENVKRGESHTVANEAVTRCPQGHPYDEANTYRYPDGKRACRICRRRRRLVHEGRA